MLPSSRWSYRCHISTSVTCGEAPTEDNARVGSQWGSNSREGGKIEACIDKASVGGGGRFGDFIGERLFWGRLGIFDGWTQLWGAYETLTIVRPGIFSLSVSLSARNIAIVNLTVLDAMHRQAGSHEEALALSTKVFLYQRSRGGG